MRVLLYNWVQFDDVRKRSGGVRVYQHNLIGELLAREIDVVTLSSGVEFDLRPGAPRVESVPSSAPKVSSFRIVNSHCPAPGHYSYDSPELFGDNKTVSTFGDFLADQGPFDIIHFDSLEGLPFTVLPLAQAHANAQVGVYAHNYFVVCPQVNLWKHEYEHCSDYDDGLGCIGCISLHASTGDALRRYRADRLFERVGLRAESPASELAIGALRLGRKLTRVAARKATLRDAPEPEPEPTAVELAPRTEENLAAADRFVARREQATELLNSNCDVLFATSQRTREVLIERGLDAAKVTTCYIGTAHAEHIDDSDRRQFPKNDGRLSLAYLGYARRDKGFYFLLDALEAADPELLTRLDLVLAAKIEEDSLRPRLSALKPRMGSMQLIDGYSHGDLPSILANVDIGLVPVQWEDNLPQVAIEFVCSGVPILTSDRGGAQELGGNNADFVFESGNRTAFIDHVTKLADHEIHLGDYWKNAMNPVVMADHVDQLLGAYGHP